MQMLRTVPLPTDQVRALQNGALDANGLKPKRVAQGGGPCRHCLQAIGKNEEKLVLCYRPFEQLQPYSESGPIFLHARPCLPYSEPNILPDMMKTWGDSLIIVRGYNSDHQIQYDAAVVVAADHLDKYCRQLLANHQVMYLHVRAAATNCYQFRIELQ